MKAAILLTCFNRKEKTLACLKSIHEQSKVDGLTIKIFLVDDGSTDGTSSAVKNDYPEVNVLQGSGDLYWNGGMNFAWETTIKEFFDFYIWMNDDISLLSNAFSIMFDAHAAAYSAHNTDPVVVGCFCEEDNISHAYGGFHVKKSLWAITKTPILPSDTVKQCDTFNGNLVLIPKSVVNKIGLLDKRYTHSFGDIDYGLRCTANNIPIYITPGYVGKCPRNPTKNSWFDPNTPLIQRYKRLTSPTGLSPSEYFYSYKKERAYIAGYLALIKLYLRLLMPKLWSKLSENKIKL
ncbi:glycosyltransferase family 2 protein, partial [Gammaproteobacteria bacterium AH-315-C21]|nr:glycosyltransferase family 2 protein [Gammaproteobacteria bacterium AH-315-C21]